MILECSVKAIKFVVFQSYFLKNLTISPFLASSALVSSFLESLMVPKDVVKEEVYFT